MSIIKSQSINLDSCSSLGKVAQRLKISRAYLSERLHVEVAGHNHWPSLQRIGGEYNPLAYLVAARLAKLKPVPVYEAVDVVTHDMAYTAIDAVSYVLAQLVGTENDVYRAPKLQGRELVDLLRAVGDICTAALSGMQSPANYEETQDDEPQAADADDAAVEP